MSKLIEVNEFRPVNDYTELSELVGKIVAISAYNIFTEKNQGYMVYGYLKENEDYGYSVEFMADFGFGIEAGAIRLDTIEQVVGDQYVPKIRVTLDKDEFYVREKDGFFTDPFYLNQNSFGKGNVYVLEGDNQLPVPSQPK